MADVDAIGRGVLADHQQFLRARGDQLFRLAQHRIDPPAGELPAQLRDDAERAGVIAALGNLEIAVVPRRQLHIGLRDQVDVGPLRRRCGFVHRLDHRLVLVRAGHREHLREARADHLGLLAHAAGHDHAAVLGDGLADRLEAFLLGGVEEAAGVDQHHVGPGVIGAHGIAVGAQAGEDAFAVDQRLGAAERTMPTFFWSGIESSGGGHDCGAPLHQRVAHALLAACMRARGKSRWDRVNWMAVIWPRGRRIRWRWLWYGPLFGTRWKREVGAGRAKRRGHAGCAGRGADLAFCDAARCSDTCSRGSRRDDAGAKPWLYFMMSGGLARRFVIPALGISYRHQPVLAPWP